MEYSPSATVGETGYWGNKYGTSSTSNQFRVWNWRSGKYKGNLGGARYYPVVNKDSGDIAIVKLNPAGEDYSIGTIRKSDGDFINYRASQDENYYFNLPQNANRVKSQALFTANKEYRETTPSERPRQTPQQLLYNNRTGNPNVAPVDDAARIAGGLGGVEDSVAKAVNQLGQSGNQGGLGLRNGSGGGGGGFLSYPSGIESSGQDYIEIASLEYKPSEIAQGGGSWSRKGSGTGRTAQSRIILPIPGGISDSNGVEWGKGEMNPIQTGAAALALGALEEGGAGIEKVAEQQMATIKGNAKLKDGLKAAIAGAVTGTNAQMLQRTEGLVMNPNMELLFGGPTLRSFSFNFKLSPRNAGESSMIIKIINTFKRSMAPQAVGGQLFLKSPMTWRLTYKHKGGDHKYLNKFKECAMTNCSVQYTDGGNYSTYEDGAMTSYGLSLSFQELEPIFAEDYQSIQGIGY